MTVIPLPARMEEAEGAGAPVGAEAEASVDPALPAEGYALETAGERPRILAADRAGEFYARLTLQQLVDEARASGRERLPALSILDAPRFSWRGAALDVARHFLPVESVLAYLDDLARLKLNRLHLHLTDDQGWRVQIDSRPELTRIGASTQVGGGGGGFYTKDDVRRILAHAAERHVVVVPEIDLPGHTTAALAAYPELAPAGPAPTPYEGIEVGFSTLDPGNEGSYRFVEDVVREVAELFPGPWLHFGGDECLATDEADYARFVQRAAAIVAGAGKTPIGWHEIGRCEALPPGTIGQYWGLTTQPDERADLLRSVVARGGAAILSPADAAYFDIRYTEDHPVGLIWPGKPTTLEDAYGWEPAEVVPGLGEDAILGLEAPIFTETIADLDTLRSMAFPRMAAFAELAWSPRPGAGGRDLDGFRERLGRLGRDWDARGVRYERVPGVPWPIADTLDR